ncbi:MAG TPA: polysaccharide deacetylase family protein, partial [Bryobacteraceae bacterium]|nr:polysaccharide deacetylase family protein [Bryobacteraceae bacterium]
MAVAGALQRAQKIVAGRFHRKLAIRSLRRPIVTFTFDDFPRSAVTTGATVLNEFGARGTYFAALGLMGKTTPVGDMFLRPDLDAVLNAGHELACHTYDHVLCSQISVDELLRNCERNRERMAELLGGYRPVNFSFPEGVVTPLAKKRLGSVYKTCRTIEPGINTDPIDLGFLRAYRVYSSSRIDALKRVIQANQRNKG